MGAGELEENAFRGFFHAVEVRPDALARTITLARHLFFVGEDAGRASHVNKEVPPFNALNGAGDDLPLPRAVFGHDGSLLGLSNLLDNDLLCGLCGDAPIVALALQREDNFIIKHRVFFYLARVFKHDVVLGVEVDALVCLIARPFFLLHLLNLLLGNDAGLIHDDFDLIEHRFPRAQVKGGPDDLTFLAVLFFIRGRERRFYRFKHLLARYAALILKLVEDGIDDF